MKIGFEIHQQLDTEKLFCRSPSMLREDPADYEVFRRLRPVQSELGVVDPAAMKEFRKGKGFVYKGYNDTICLVELDEEPPNGPNGEAIDIALTIALMLNAQIVDEIHFMRKMVIDGSNTSGFQRTAVIAFDGHLDTKEGRINIPMICLEEEAARKVSDDGHTTTYNLDRLGIPLIEITTAPDIKSPEQARDAALKIGERLRETGRVKRGIGTIRQDINVSIEGGRRAEIKGVQELNTIPLIIENEVKRQRGLIRISQSLEDRKVMGDEIKGSVHDVTGVFKNTDSAIIKNQLKRGKVLAAVLRGFGGLLGGGLLGREMAGYVRVHTGLKGIFHSDELPAYGITEREIASVKKVLDMHDDDAFVLVAGPEKKCRYAFDVVFERASLALKGPLEETRNAKDTESEYMRPLPGAARMYPETDIPPYVVPKKHIDYLKANLPEGYEEKTDRFLTQFNLGLELGKQIVRSGHSDLFEKLVQTGVPVTTVASTILEVRKDLDNGKIKQEDLQDIFMAVSGKKISKEAISYVIEDLRDEKVVAESIKERGSGEVDLNALVDLIISEKADFIREKGMFAVKPLMGLVMKETRGKVDGKKVNELLLEKIKKLTSA